MGTPVQLELDEALALLKSRRADEYFAMKARQADEIDAVHAANPGGDPRLREILEHAAQDLRDEKLWDDAVCSPSSLRT